MESPSNELTISRALSAEERERGLAALQQLSGLQREMLRRRGRRPFPDSAVDLNRLRDQRTRDLRRSSVRSPHYIDIARTLVNVSMGSLNCGPWRICPSAMEVSTLVDSPALIVALADMMDQRRR